jgi:hypothetical protein
MHIVVMTNGEWMAFRLVCELLRQIDKDQDDLTVWDDESPDEYRRQMGKLARVLVHPLNKNFAEHVNALKEVFPKGEWILYLDADEMILPGFLAATRGHMQVNKKADAIYFERRNTTWAETGSPNPPEPLYVKDPDFQPRAFINNESIHYERFVHQLLKGDRNPLYLRGRPITILHHKNDDRPKYETWPEYATWTSTP